MVKTSRRPSVAVTIAITATLLLPAFRVSADDTAAERLRTGPTVVFLGDSITAAGQYVDDIETALLLDEGTKVVPRIIALGLSSETASGLTEQDHPFPRPCVHERLARVLKATKPDVVVACYGMNDGIYHPFSEERFAAYQQGIRELIRKVHGAGARMVLLTPPPYAGTVVPVAGPKRGEPFGYKTPDPDYDAVLARYADWVLTLGFQNHVEAIDIRTPMLPHLAEEYRGDPIHPTPFGHRVMARAVLAHWNRVVPDASQSGIPLSSDGERWSAVRMLVAQRRQTYDRKLLWEIGHQRPGKEPPLTMTAAQQEAARIDREIGHLLPFR